jgi:2-polyprenyl-3-methyl-5-hydroxy-6-metoxy-1,4-benzoquinol methylase
MRADYEQVLEGSYKSLKYKEPKDLYFNDYWSHARKHSTIHEQQWNVADKNKLVIRDLTKILPRNVLEIACAPGLLLQTLAPVFSCVGIEVDPANKEAIQTIASKAELHFGFFPDVTKNWPGSQFSNIVALDVLEHVEDGIGFLRECWRLLVPQGHLIIQAPLILQDGLQEPDYMFGAADEHIGIYDIKHLTAMLRTVGFELLRIDRWKLEHEHIVARRISN